MTAADILHCVVNYRLPPPDTVRHYMQTTRRQLALNLIDTFIYLITSTSYTFNSSLSTSY